MNCGGRYRIEDMSCSGQDAYERSCVDTCTTSDKQYMIMWKQLAAPGRCEVPAVGKWALARTCLAHRRHL